MEYFKNKTLNKNIPIPLYYQLKEILLEYIKEYHKDEELPIPTEKELSEHFQISRPTVRQAINELVVEGYLYRKKAKGTFVSKPKIRQDFLLILDSFENEMKKKGLKPSTKLLNIEVTRSDEKVSKALNIPLGSEVVKLTRLRFANDEPIVLVVTYLPHDKCKGIMDKDLEKESMYDILEKDFGYNIARATRTLESIVAGEYEAKLLDIKKGAPIQYFESVAYLTDNTPIEYSLAKYRGDRNKFSFELKREGRF
ncbi:MAG: GntR family transcriptional regulator [Clostridiales bacterium]|nr:GntR family transcriptional regulator [Clostridiales bacterium]